MLLTEAAEIMREHPDEIIRINGHTDSTGTSEDNQSLSERRANSAFDYLVQTLGLPAERFIVTGYGEDKPVASNDTVEGRRMNRRVEIAGDLTEVERAQLYQTRTNEMLAILNGVEMALGSHGQFRTSIDGARSDVVTLELTNEIGAGIDTTIRLPKLTVIEPSGTEYRAFANGQSLSAADGSANLEGSLSYRLVGETDVGNHIELNQQVLEVDAAGRFEAQLDLTTGRNAHVLSARNEKGFVRYANVNINVRTDDYGEPIVAVEPIPKLVLQLPPKGVPMRSANLAIPGYTDPGNTVMINGQRIPVGPDGRFFAAMPLKLRIHRRCAVHHGARGRQDQPDHARGQPGRSRRRQHQRDGYRRPHRHVSQGHRTRQIPCHGGVRFRHQRNRGAVQRPRRDRERAARQKPGSGSRLPGLRRRQHAGLRHRVQGQAVPVLRG
jgi:hypothetical protein